MRLGKNLFERLTHQGTFPPREQGLGRLIGKQNFTVRPDRNNALRKRIDHAVLP